MPDHPSLPHNLPHNLPCKKCGSHGFLIEEDRGVTFGAVRCTFCDLRTEAKTLIGHALPWVGPALSLAIALLTGHSPSDPSDGSCST